VSNVSVFILTSCKRDRWIMRIMSAIDLLTSINDNLRKISFIFYYAAMRQMYTFSFSDVSI